MRRRPGQSGGTGSRGARASPQDPEQAERRFDERARQYAETDPCVATQHATEELNGNRLRRRGGQHRMGGINRAKIIAVVVLHPLAAIISQAIPVIRADLDTCARAEAARAGPYV